MDAFSTFAERKAREAESYEAFGGFSLLQTRRDLEELLGRIGQLGFFDEYTKHDITHIDAMLEKLDWLIPDETKNNLTASDWLLIVLSAYFHDLGMLVTRAEYRRRDESAFAKYRDEVLLTDDPGGRDYSSRIAEMDDDQRERFLYQEFVRENHALRVKNWILGEDSFDPGVSTSMMLEVKRMLASLEPVFRDDLAQVCESHHLQDLYDTNIYPVQQYYGNSSQEVANVQYAAILLRTIDLLHITRDRTPSIAFRVLSPADPISQVEWAKQMAVRAVKPLWGLDSDGNRSETAPREAIAVYAKFTDGDGFFGLTSYLRYAVQELRTSHDWIQRSNLANGLNYQFPWKSIDTSRIEAKGFLTQTFHFSLDQAKVLDLLTGHTLYNDSNVVLRELLQNSIDAVRLEHGELSQRDGKVWVRWDAESRTLEIRDNGSGMTQEIIERNLLKAGSSRYQDPEFRKKNPTFSPISRFGIGVLSTFMVADEVEIITCHPDDDEARQLSLRSVHGEYLVRTLSKTELAEDIRPHGTCVRLKVRPSADVGDVAEIAQRWIVLPECNVMVDSRSGGWTHIGYTSVSEALRHAIAEHRADLHEQLDQAKIRIVEKNIDGLSIAYAVRWNEHFNEWTFLPFPTPSYAGGHASLSLAGTCIGGIRVESYPPGFRHHSGVWALANAWGPRAPQTNVARSAIDATPEFNQVTEKIYSAYCDHIRNEVEELQSDRSYSLTWATGEAAIISQTLLLGDAFPVSRSSLRQGLSHVPLFLLEQSGTRRQASAAELLKFDALYMTESAVMEHVEYLLRELPGGSRTSLMKVLADAEGQVDTFEPVICTRLGNHDNVDDFFLSAWQISEIRASKEDRRCDLKWIKRNGTSLWSDVDLQEVGLGRLLSEQEPYGRRRNHQMVRIPIAPVPVSGFVDNEIGVNVGGSFYLIPGHPWERMIEEMKQKSDWSGACDERAVALSWMIGALISTGSAGRMMGQRAYAHISDSLDDMRIHSRRLEISHLFDFEAFADGAMSRSLEFFDTRRWQRLGGLFY
ncbi:ATP-binding protein [Streptomyces sp. AC536]|uniref:HD domain-containing protein n=1 Tax=Streptomyces buecherae TaxID=2763006 RepID=UPI00164D8A0A|nr:ATP-binding protein [Streptomyces buecherae]MBC3985593.1 ATP-binding protein [Streptomyces buecherae]QNJ40177.1 ATP-binding protein [Streptomyces buecherae]